MTTAIIATIFLASNQHAVPVEVGSIQLVNKLISIIASCIMFLLCISSTAMCLLFKEQKITIDVCHVAKWKCLLV